MQNQQRLIGSLILGAIIVSRSLVSTRKNIVSMNREDVPGDGISYNVYIKQELKPAMNEVVKRRVEVEAVARDCAWEVSVAGC
jgi:hypothetical protein